jgi:hypothetical protein
MTALRTQRACNGCRTILREISEDERDRAVAGLPAADVRIECPDCQSARIAELRAALDASQSTFAHLDREELRYLLDLAEGQPPDYRLARRAGTEPTR